MISYYIPSKLLNKSYIFFYIIQFIFFLNSTLVLNLYNTTVNTIITLWLFIQKKKEIYKKFKKYRQRTDLSEHINRPQYITKVIFQMTKYNPINRYHYAIYMNGMITIIHGSCNNLSVLRIITRTV